MSANVWNIYARELVRSASDYDVNGIRFRSPLSRYFVLLWVQG